MADAPEIVGRDIWFRGHKVATLRDDAPSYAVDLFEEFLRWQATRVEEDDGEWI
jgi:hypothetical protein